MAKVNLPGLGKSKGLKPMKPADPGDYEVEITKCEVRTTEAGDGTLVMPVYQPFDGPEQSDGRDPSAVRIYDMIWIPDESHHAYDEMYERQVDILASLMIAAGAKSKSDAFDPEVLVGKQVGIRVAHEVRKEKGSDDPVLDDEGNPVVDARVKRYFALGDEEE